MPRKKKLTRRQRFIEEARRQFRRSCIPTATAVLLSVGISKLGIPALPLIAVGGAGVAWWKGYRLRVVRLDDDADQDPTILGAGPQHKSQTDGGEE
jgi:hypothetical protein